MKFFIPIDKGTLRRNPHAGQMSFSFPGRCETGGRLVIQKGKLVAIEPHPQRVQTIYSTIPEPNWLYEYVPTSVQCKYCKTEFPHTELQEDYLDDEEGGCILKNICPECGESFCCEIEFEASPK